jgi:hypothetical protein
LALDFLCWTSKMFLPLFGEVLYLFLVFVSYRMNAGALGGSSEQKKYFPSPLLWIKQTFPRESSGSSGTWPWKKKKEDSSLSLSPLFSVCWVSLVWRAGGQSGGEAFFISVCVVASASFHQVNYPFREQRRADMRGMQPSDEFDWSRAERVCLLVYFFSSLHPTAMETLV